MRKKSNSPPLTSDLHALAGLYVTVLREIGHQARIGHALPPHRHQASLQQPDERRAKSLTASR